MTLDELRAILRLCTAPGTSPFYRKLYGLSDADAPLDAPSWEAWHRLPTFSKEHLTKETLPGRVFPPWSNIDAILASSGTSGNPPVYSSWVRNDGYAYRYEYHDFKRGVFSSMPTPFQQDWIIEKHGGGPLVILDPRRAAASVKLAKAAGVDSMLLILHHVPLIADEMTRAGISTDIKFIEIAGETSSLSLFQHMRRTFPNATITAIYGSSDVETSPIGIPCRPMTDGDPRAVYHAGPRTHLELVDRQSGAPLEARAGIEADLVISSYAGPDATFPLIRYRIGDIVRVIEEHCAEHGSWSFEVVGRTEMDFLKVPGGILRADEVERVLRKLKISDRFELHRYEVRVADTLKIRVVLKIEVPEGMKPHEAAKLISGQLRVSSNYTYDMGVSEGHYIPLECEQLPRGPRLGKSVRMVAH